MNKFGFSLPSQYVEDVINIVNQLGVEGTIDAGSLYSPLARILSGLERTDWLANSGPKTRLNTALTITQGAQNGSRTLAVDLAGTAGLTSLQNFLRVYGWNQEKVVGSFGTPGCMIYPNTSYQLPFNFTHYGQSIEFYHGSSMQGFTLMVDGEYITNPAKISTLYSAGVAGATLINGQQNCWIKVNFGSVALRNITLQCGSAFGLREIAVAATDTVTTWDRSKDPTILCISDSYGQGNSNNWYFGAPMADFAAMIGGAGMMHMDAIGGTGYAVNSGDLDPNHTFVNRIQTHTAYNASDIVLIIGGLNDNNGVVLAPYASVAAAAAGFQAAVLRTYQLARQQWPNAVIYVMGAQTPSNVIANAPNYARHILKIDTMKAALKTIAGPWVFVDPITDNWTNSSGRTSLGANYPWFTGTGNSGALAGNGNCDVFSDDGTHPNNLGNFYLAQQLAKTFRTAVRSL